MIGAPDSNVSYAPILAHKIPMYVGMSVQDANIVGAQDSRIPESPVYTAFIPNWNPARSKVLREVVLLSKFNL
jgi:hypothetical protein